LEYFYAELKIQKHGKYRFDWKYVEMQDCYKSILESFIHAGAANETKVNVVSIF
jgi:CTP synthase